MKLATLLAQTKCLFCRSTCDVEWTVVRDEYDMTPRDLVLLCHRCRINTWKEPMKTRTATAVIFIGTLLAIAVAFALLGLAITALTKVLP